MKYCLVDIEKIKNIRFNDNISKDYYTEEELQEKLLKFFKYKKLYPKLSSSVIIMKYIFNIE